MRKYLLLVYIYSYNMHNYIMPKNQLQECICTLKHYNYNNNIMQLLYSMCIFAQLIIAIYYVQMQYSEA